MNKKNILITCNRELGFGGIEKALVAFVNAFDKEKYDITLVLRGNSGVFFPQLKTDNISLFFTNTINASQVFKDDVKHFRIKNIIKGLYNRLMMRLDKNWYAQIMYMYRSFSHAIKFDKHFDCAISFSTDYSDLGIITSADADKRAAFVHADASLNKRIAKLNDKLLSSLDKIYCVSSIAQDQFVSVHPTCSNMMDVFHNIIDEKEIKEKAESQIDDMITDSAFTLCTVGRVSPEKGQNLIPKCAKIILSSGIDFKWYIIGDGSLFEPLSKEIAKQNLSDNILLLGSKSNPYPYIKNCDIYVQTSYTEAYCITVREALILQRPIVSTNFTSVDEQIRHGINGMIAEMTPESLSKNIIELINNTELRKAIKNNLLSTPSQRNDLENLYTFISQQEQK